MSDARTVTERLYGVLDDARLGVPLLPIVNPPLWELGHVGWFYEFWLCRGGDFNVPCMLTNGDRLYDSARVPHDSRWTLPLPDLVTTWRYVDRVLEKVRDALSRGEPDDETAYFTQLSVFHHDMHNEAFSYMWQTLGYPFPGQGTGGGAACDAEGDVDIPAGSFLMGAAPQRSFAFDNEKWAHEVHVPAFRIARRTVTNREFMAFVDDGGYSNRAHWSDAGWAMRESLSLIAPRYWRWCDCGWQQRRFDQWVSVLPDEPVMHVSWHEAQAYCSWTGRRLPTEAEWERAAATAPGRGDTRRYPWGTTVPTINHANLDAARALPVKAASLPAGASAWGLFNMLGNVWEWTESRFAPYPGFSPDPYKEYSAPWFADDHRVLRGGSFVTPSRLISTRWRNFYMPHRADFFCGFRTCALRA